MLPSSLISPAAGSLAAIVGTSPVAQRSAGDGSASPDSFAQALNEASSPPPPPATAPPTAPAQQEPRADASTADATTGDARPAASTDSTVAPRPALQRKAAVVPGSATEDKSPAAAATVALVEEPAQGPWPMQPLDNADAEHADGGKGATPDAAGLGAVLVAANAAAPDRPSSKALGTGSVGAVGATGPSRTGSAPATDAAGVAAAAAGPARRSDTGAETPAAAGDQDKAPRASAAGSAAVPAAAATTWPAASTPLPPPTPGPATAAASAGASTVAEGRLPASPGSADFAPALGAQLSTFLRDGIQHARLQLHPAELGPLTVQILLDGASAQVRLAAEHPLTRQALEQAMPTLAGTLRESGLTLTGGGVFEQPANPQPQQEGSATNGERSTGSRNSRDGQDNQDSRDPALQAHAAALRPVTTRRGVVDLVA